MLRYLFLFLVIFFANTNLVQAESIKNFAAEYVVQKDGTVEVVETIAYDFESSSRHGIYRDLDKKHAQPPTEWYKTRWVEIDILSVLRDGLNEPYVVSDSNTMLNIKIGDPDRTITGLHTYKITYRLIGALSYGGDGAEFYWNVTGNNWSVPISQATALVQGESLGILTDQSACYQGLLGSSSSCDVNERRIDGSVFFKASSLGVGYGLTVATELDPTTVAFLTTEKTSYFPLVLLLVTLWLIFFSYKVYRFRTQAKTKLPVIAQYEPYENYLPMYTGVLYDGRLDPRDITAGILYLAEQGFIKIRKTEKKVMLLFTVDDYEIVLMRPLSEIPTKFLRELSGLLFAEHDAPPASVMLSGLAKNRTENYKLVQSLNSSLKKDVIKAGFKIKSWPSFGWLLIIAPIVIFAVFIWLGMVEEGIFLAFYALIPTIILIVLLLSARLTRKGYEVENYLDGFRLFLSVTNKERFDFHNAPEKSPELFMKYLPYAVALGVEKKWSKVFEGITIPQPDWYEGDHIGTFSATELTSDIAAFSSAFTANTSSGTSGSSGGGFSGGGGGGGGGGSW
ncbi:MAG: DUF2207 domain-containing protein [Candidatus Nomurabacteria bacterium]|nr:MAG: DUF2207 domain-containing protein [Candidatus Nomurabacteria bacterium]